MDTSPKQPPGRRDVESASGRPEPDAGVIDLTEPAVGGAEARPVAPSDVEDRFVVGWAIEDMG